MQRPVTFERHIPAVHRKKKDKMNSKNSLETECKRLWKETFGDSDEFISSFMEHHFRKENMLYIEECGRVLSMLHIIPFELCGRRVAYMYAVATESNARGKGLATRLIEQAIKKVKSSGYSALITLPADDGLRKFYTRFGFKGAFPVKFITPDDFDFGTGDPEKEIVAILPFDKEILPLLEGGTIILKKENCK